jgi:hypothetical protein
VTPEQEAVVSTLKLGDIVQVTIKSIRDVGAIVEVSQKKKPECQPFARRALFHSRGFGG